MGKTLQNRRVQGIVLLCIFNLVIRAGWVLLIHPPQQFDFLWYFTHASQMANNQGYTANHQYTAYWPMGYPFFLSILFRVFGTVPTVGIVANMFLSTGIVILVVLFTERLTKNTSAGIISGFGYSLLPSQIEWNSVLGSEELATFLTLLGLYLYICTSECRGRRMGWIVFGGVIFGIACDVRPIPLLFPIALWFYEVAIKRSKWTTATLRIVVLYFGVAIGMCPLTIRNFISLHQFVLVSTNGGVNLWQGTMADGAYYWSWSHKVNPLLAAGTNEILANKIGTHAFVEHVLHHPFSVMVHGVMKWFFLYWVDWNVVGVTVAQVTKSLILIRLTMWFNTVVYWGWMVVTSIGMWTLGQNGTVAWRRPEYALPVVFIAYNTVVFFFFPAWDRFRYPLMPMFAVFFGVGWTWLSHRKGRRSLIPSSE